MNTVTRQLYDIRLIYRCGLPEYRYICLRERDEDTRGSRDITRNSARYQPRYLMGTTSQRHAVATLPPVSFDRVLGESESRSGLFGR
jgi:hypothetical protein